MNDPRLKILYLLGISIGVFLSELPAVLLGLLGLQLVLWFGAGLTLDGLGGTARRMFVFIAFIVLSYTFFGRSEGDFVYALELFGLTLPVNLSGLEIGLLRSSRIVTIILAAQIVQQTGKPTDFVEGLRVLRVPRSFAQSLDLLLAALGSAGGGQGGGRRRRQREQAGDGEEPRKLFKRMMRGDVQLLADSIERNVQQIRERVALRGLPAGAAGDLSVIVGLAVLAMTLRFIKIAPGIPFAPDHKGVLLIPLYIFAHRLTATRWGSVQFGFLVGVTSFMMGHGRFGPFEIFRHAAPGLFVDLAMPLVSRWFARPGAVLYGLIGVGAAMTRLTTFVALALVVEAPPGFYVLLLPVTISYAVFGALSGGVTFHLMKFETRFRAAPQSPQPAGPAPSGHGEETAAATTAGKAPTRFTGSKQA